MELEINRKVDIEVDNQLGYPMVFVEAPNWDPKVLEYIKRNIFGAIEKGPDLINWDVSTPALKEYLVIARWMAKGYLCYPANQSGMCIAHNCGPKYIKEMYGCVRDIDKWAEAELYELCKAIELQTDAMVNILCAPIPQATATAQESELPASDPNYFLLREGFNKSSVKLIKFLWRRKAIWPPEQVEKIILKPLREGLVYLDVPEDGSDFKKQFYELLMSKMGERDKTEFPSVWEAAQHKAMLEQCAAKTN